jgi:uncharacterized membrane protein YphA (DoxX/SURF4 family)
LVLSIRRENALALEAGALRGIVDPAILLARALMSYVFIVEGYGKLLHYSDVGEYMQSHGVPQCCCRWSS